MKKSTAVKSLFILAALGIGLLACLGSPATTTAKSDNVIMLPPAKASAPVQIGYTVPQSIKKGESAPLSVRIWPEAAAKELTLKLVAGDHLEVISGKTEYSYGDTKAGTKLTEIITVVPQEEGVLYLNVFVTGKFGEASMARVGAIPIPVGDGDSRKQLKQSGQSVTTPSGDKLIIMPAQEK